jgi:hypothetical protein
MDFAKVLAENKRRANNTVTRGFSQTIRSRTPALPHELSVRFIFNNQQTVSHKVPFVFASSCRCVRFVCLTGVCFSRTGSRCCVARRVACVILCWRKTLPKTEARFSLGGRFLEESCKSATFVFRKTRTSRRCLRRSGLQKKVAAN